MRIEPEVKKNKAKQQENNAPINLPPAKGNHSKLLRKLLQQGDVSTKMNVKKLFAFVECLCKYRNHMAHCELENADGWEVEGLLHKMLRYLEC